MSKTYIVYTCCHADPSVPNDRFDWLGKLIEDVQPDVTVDLGDFWDLRSLNTYDERYPQNIVAQNYELDINHGKDAQERIWERFKRKKKKRPKRVGIEGNHEFRLTKAIAVNPRLEGREYGISTKHFELDRWYDEYYGYTNGAPSIVFQEGIAFSHFFSNSSYGNAISGKHHAYSLLEYLSCSAVCGHSHELHYYRKSNTFPNSISALVAGCYKGAEETWAGQANRKWSSGVAILRGVESGYFDLEWVSQKRMREEYE